MVEALENQQIMMLLGIKEWSRTGNGIQIDNESGEAQSHLELGNIEMV